MPDAATPRQFRSNFEPSMGWDPEVLERGVLEPPTDLERQGAGKLSPTDLEIFAHKLDAIVDEGMSVFEGLSMSETLMIGDGGVSLFTAEGDMSATAASVYMHAILNYGPIKYVLKHFRNDPTVGIRDGDMFIVNEALSGGVHPADIFINMPIFYQGQLVAWAGAGGHQGEVGGRDPGGWTPGAKSRFEEGIHLTPLKICENFEPKRDLFEFICSSVRNPRTLALDLKTRMAVCSRIRDRVLKECDKHGPDVFAAGQRAIIEQSARMACARVRSLNDGVYRTLGYLDTIGADEGLLRIAVTMIKQGDRLTIDLTGCSPEPRVGPFHLFWHLARACTAVFLFTHVFRDLPFNNGVFAPIDLIAPKGCWVNASPDVPQSAANWAGRVVVETVQACGLRMLYDSPLREAISAPWAVNNTCMMVGGRDQYGYPMAGFSSSINAGGQGARWDMDGENAAGFFWSPSVDQLDVEEMEAKFPWIYLSRNIYHRNLHGYGKYRGGVGLCDIWVPHQVQRIPFGATTGTGDRYTMSMGLFGGYHGPPNHRIIIRNSNVKELMRRSDPHLPRDLHELLNEKAVQGDWECVPSNLSGVAYEGNDLMIAHIGSGGGYGDVLERDPAAVMADLRAELITDRIAREIYQVAWDPVTLAADLPETERLRVAERQARKARGRTWDQFHATWLQQRPAAAALKYYGEWPGGWPHYEVNTP